MCSEGYRTRKVASEGPLRMDGYSIPGLVPSIHPFQGHQTRNNGAKWTGTTHILYNHSLLASIATVEDNDDLSGTEKLGHLYSGVFKKWSG
jgi:hypothetical protein